MIAFEVALLRLALAVLFGSIIGLERQWRHKNAGIKTNTLVAVGAAAFAMMSDTFGPDNHNPAQIAAAVVTGIGFIGAGVIIHRGATVQGVTTAATLWANASAGLAAGLGQYALAGVVVAAIVIVQFTMRRVGFFVANHARRDAPSRFEVAVECDADKLESVNDLWMSFASETGLTALRRSYTRGHDTLTWRGTFRANEPGAIDLTTVEEKLAAMQGIRRVETRFIGFDDESSPGM